jgi:hypothetical protein
LSLFRLLFPACAAVFSAMLLFVPAAAASIGVEVGDDAYVLLERLEAEGVIESGLLDTRPISRKEALRLALEAERNSRGRSPFVRAIASSLKERFSDEFREVNYIKPLGRAYFGYVYSDQKAQELNYDSDGDLYEDGSNLRAGLTSMAEFGRFSLFLRPELRYSAQDTDMVMRKAHGTFDFIGLELLAGKDSQWWGPGRNGALLISNNAEPFTMFKLSNPTPVLLPWVFERLGPFRFVFFVTRLGEERAVPEPYLWGLRLDFKPVPYLEVGFERTAMLGGRGRSEDLATWWRSLTGRGENETGKEAGDQRAGFNIKMTFPFRLQPVQLYVEAAGEDEAGGWPSKWAYLWGVYLPRTLGLERLGLRAEYATDHVSGSPNVWYNHHIYASGYTYDGRIIGHHMGTDSRDLFLETTWLMPEVGGSLSLAYDREKHNLSGNSRPEITEYSVSGKMGITGDLTLEGRAAFGRIKDVTDEDASLLLVFLNYLF